MRDEGEDEDGGTNASEDDGRSVRRKPLRIDVSKAGKCPGAETETSSTAPPCLSLVIFFAAIRNSRQYGVSEMVRLCCPGRARRGHCRVHGRSVLCDDDQ